MLAVDLANNNVIVVGESPVCRVVSVLGATVHGRFNGVEGLIVSNVVRTPFLQGCSGASQLGAHQKTYNWSCHVFPSTRYSL